jgi:catechol-2,3-dioxygenase
VERVSRFYREALELAEVDRHLDDSGVLRSVWLQLGGGTLLMVERSEAGRGRVDGVGAGLFLLALHIEPAERAPLERRLAAHGAPIESRSAYSSYARDPEGNRIAISHYPAPAPR